MCMTRTKYYITGLDHWFSDYVSGRNYFTAKNVVKQIKAWFLSFFFFLDEMVSELSIYRQVVFEYVLANKIHVIQI